MDRVKKIIAEYSSDKEVRSDQLLVDDLGLDSLDFLEVVFELEDEYDISIADSDTDKWSAVKDVEDYISSVLNS